MEGRWCPTCGQEPGTGAFCQHCGANLASTSPGPPNDFPANPAAPDPEVAEPFVAPDPTTPVPAGSGGDDDGAAGSPPDGWPPNAGPGPNATPSRSASGDDGTTYADYEFEGIDEGQATAQEIHHELTENGFEPQGFESEAVGEGDDMVLQNTYRNGETGETVVVGHGQDTDGTYTIETTYTP